MPIIYFSVVGGLTGNVILKPPGLVDAAADSDSDSGSSCIPEGSKYVLFIVQQSANFKTPFKDSFWGQTAWQFARCDSIELSLHGLFLF